MRYAFVNGIILDGTEDMQPVRGKAVLTDRGRRFLTAYRRFESVVHAYADEIFEDMFGEDPE